jgi:hypothetical protein
MFEELWWLAFQKCTWWLSPGLATQWVSWRKIKNKKKVEAPEKKKKGGKEWEQNNTLVSCFFCLPFCSKFMVAPSSSFTIDDVVYIGCERERERESCTSLPQLERESEMPPRSSFIFSFFFSEGEHSYLYPVKYTAGALHCKIPLPPHSYSGRELFRSSFQSFFPSTRL